MRRIVPYPLLTLALAFMWLVLAGWTPGQLLLAAIVALGASHALRTLGETSPRIRRWLAIPELLGYVLTDIVRSNIDVARIIMQGRRPANHRAAFIVLPLNSRNPNVLASLAVVITSTPGTAWVDYNSARGEVLVHVFDLVDEAYWQELIVGRYERLLREIYE